MTFQPYQEAGEEMKKQSQLPLKLLKQGSSLAGLAVGATSLSRVFPLLNSLIPIDITKKGLAKIDSRYGKFFNAAEKLGHSDAEAREFLKEKLTPGVEEEEELSAKEKATQANLKRSQQRQSDFSRESLQQQFDQGQQQPQGKQALLQTMQEITQALRQMRGQGG